MIENQKNQQVIEEFKKRRSRQLAVTIPFIAVMLLFFWLENIKIEILPGVSSQVHFGFFMVLIVGLVIFSLKNWCCPACKGYLGKAFNPRFCQKCGAQLRD